MFVYFQDRDPKTQITVTPVHANNGYLNMQNLDQIQLILTKQIWTKPIPTDLDQTIFKLLCTNPIWTKYYLPNQLEHELIWTKPIQINMINLHQTNKNQTTINQQHEDETCNNMPNNNVFIFIFFNF